ncbi:hypothetical protein [Cryobacterium sp. M23]|uniref:hypothetical protein n=1 Tax=Cryobacterium sp. M23 TaxID=2048292 RepID=UPI001304F762|nr:hypothetical protein [Cryobacterium sp. M23]
MPRSKLGPNQRSRAGPGRSPIRPDPPASAAICPELPASVALVAPPRAAHVANSGDPSA